MKYFKRGGEGMSRLKKAISLSLILLLLIMSGSLMLANIKSILMPKQFKLLNIIPKPTGIISTTLSYYLFWLAFIVSIVLLIVFIGILFYPKHKTEVKLQENKGKLVLTNSAIEGLVKSILNQRGFMRTPKVTARLHKKKIHVNVKGDIIHKQSVAERTEQVKKEISQGLQEFVGLNNPLKLTVEVVGFDNAHVSKRSVSRVQ